MCDTQRLVAQLHRLNVALGDASTSVVGRATASDEDEVVVDAEARGDDGVASDGARKIEQRSRFEPSDHPDYVGGDRYFRTSTYTKVITTTMIALAMIGAQRFAAGGGIDGGGNDGGPTRRTCRPWPVKKASIVVRNAS